MMDVKIRNLKDADRPHVFTVTVDDTGEIQRYNIKHINKAHVDREDVILQIQEALRQEKYNR